MRVYAKDDLSMKKQDFTKETEAHLTQTLGKMREEVRAFRFSSAGSAARDVKSLRANKKGIARVLTELHKRTHAA